MAKLEQAEILLVEDDSREAEAVMQCFRQARLANPLHWAKDPAEAVEYLYSGEGHPKPRLMLLDLKLPRQDGLDLLVRAKSEPRTRHIPIIMLTSSSFESDLIQSYDLGVESCLVKPIDFQRFGREVEKTGFHWLLLGGSE